jgi:pyruvate dehydrogenase (quinone)
MRLLDQVEKVEHSPLRPQMVVRALSDLINPDAVISLDCGANTFSPHGTCAGAQASA